MWHRFDLWRSCYWDGEEEEKEGIKEKRCGGEQGGSHITGTNCSRWRSQMGGGNKKWRKKRNRNMGMVEGGVMTAGENEWEIFWLYIWPLPSGLTSSFFIASHIKVSSLIFSTADIVISPTEVIDQPCGTVLLSACSIITVDFCPLTVWCPPPSPLFLPVFYIFLPFFFFFFTLCLRSTF